MLIFAIEPVRPTLVGEVTWLKAAIVLSVEPICNRWNDFSRLAAATKTNGKQHRKMVCEV